MDTELESFLNSLGEAERAGGRILHELTNQPQSLELREMLKTVGHDEGYYAGELAAHVRRLGGTPSTRTGDFVEKVRAVGDLKGKLELLNRGHYCGCAAASVFAGDGGRPRRQHRRTR
jgi:nitronate monooxygenase